MAGRPAYDREQACRASTELTWREPVGEAPRVERPARSPAGRSAISGLAARTRLLATQRLQAAALRLGCGDGVGEAQLVELGVDLLDPPAVGGAVALVDQGAGLGDLLPDVLQLALLLAQRAERTGELGRTQHSLVVG